MKENHYKIYVYYFKSLFNFYFDSNMAAKAIK